jgi:hypothetical protein
MRINVFFGILFMFVLVFSLPVFAENPKLYESIRVKITQSGMIIANDVINLNMTTFIPQENTESINVFTDGGEWRYIYDEFGNKKISMEWKKPGNVINYKIETIVQNSAEHAYNDKKIGNDQNYVTETKHVILSDEIRKISYPYEKTLRKVAELTKFVHYYLTYDLTYSGREMTSSDVLLERKSVCSGYSTLLTAMLRTNNIPTRYVSGYAYSDFQKKFIGHAWVEVLADDGTWISFDPTWLQGGFIDATHIRAGSTLDSTSTIEISYIKTSKQGNITWNENDDNLEILDYEIKSPISLDLGAKRSIFSNAFGYMKATINSDECLISEITAVSCVNENDADIFDIYDSSRTVWSCGNHDEYFFFDPVNKQKNRYVCPVVVYDQLGNKDSINITVYDKERVDKVEISGPEIVKINEDFQLTSSADRNFIFYSLDFGKHDNPVWDLSIKTPGTYKFYLYSDGVLAIKDIHVVEQKEFDLLLSTQKNVTIYGSFIATISVKNLLPKEKTAKIVVDFDGQKLEKTETFDASGERVFEFNLTAKTLGTGKVSASVLSDTLTPYPSSIYVYEIKSSNSTDNTLKGIMDFFAGIIKWLQGLF